MQDPHFVQQAFGKIANRYVCTNHITSMGLDLWWRHVATKIIQSWQPKKLIDVATGTGDLALSIQHACPETQITATDFSPEMLQHAARRGLANTQLADGMNLPFSDQEFDTLTVAFGLRNMAHYLNALKEMKRVIKPDGHLLILDFSLPKNPCIRSLYRIYLHHILPHIAGFLTNEKKAYQYLGGTIEEFPAGAAMCDLMNQAGFTNPKAIPLTFGIVSIYTATVQ